MLHPSFPMLCLKKQGESERKKVFVQFKKMSFPVLIVCYNNFLLKRPVFKRYSISICWPVYITDKSTNAVSKHYYHDRFEQSSNHNSDQIGLMRASLFLKLHIAIPTIFWQFDIAYQPYFDSFNIPLILYSKLISLHLFDNIGKIVFFDLFLLSYFPGCQTNF